jgi:hypothetical protein
VETLGLLIAAVGSALLMSSTRRRQSPEVVALGVGSAAALGGAGAVFALRGRISKIYLAEAGLEALIVVAWAASQEKSAGEAVQKSATLLVRWAQDTRDSNQGGSSPLRSRPPTGIPVSAES